MIENKYCKRCKQAYFSEEGVNFCKKCGAELVPLNTIKKL